MKHKKKKSPLERIMKISAIILFLVVVYGMLYSCSSQNGFKFGIFNWLFPTKKVGEVSVSEMYLTKNEFSRPGDKLKKVKGIVIHYTANPGSSAENNRNYFEGLKDSGATYASSHYIVGLEGEVIQCVPLDEIAYASNERNKDTISIECCHEDESGIFNEETYESLIKLVAWLCGEYNLKQDDIIRHYDVTGKMCPKYYVEHDDAWKQFKKDVFEYIEDYESEGANHENTTDNGLGT